jgi:hypothetical protein
MHLVLSSKEMAQAIVEYLEKRFPDRAGTGVKVGIVFTCQRDGFFGGKQVFEAEVDFPDEQDTPGLRQ